MPPTARVPFDLDEAERARPEVTPQQRTAAESIIDLLCDQGLDTYFGLPGGPIIPIFDAILTNPRARLIEPRHETYGTFAAMGYHRASGKVPVVVVTAGPGATNVVTGVVAAHMERVPMLVICGDVPWAATGRKMFQDTGEDGIGIGRMLKGVSRAVVRVAQPQSASSQVCAALQAATNPANPGPAVVVISIDRAGSKTNPPRVFAQPQASTVPPPDESVLREVCGRLTRAHRPLILVGAGCRNSAQRIIHLAEVLGVPFATTPQAKGILSEAHPLSLGTCGVGASLWARRYIGTGPDACLVLGTDLDDMSTTGTPPIGSGGFLVHVDQDPAVFARNVPTALAVVHDVGAFASAAASFAAGSGARRDSLALLREVRAETPFDVEDFAKDESTPIAPHRAIADLSSSLGANAVFVTDIGEHTLFALHYLKIEPPRSFVVHLGLGSMGSGIASAIGQALGNPESQVVCICGDGGMEMAGMELLVAVKLRLPIIYAVFNDARYNMVYHGYRMTFGRDAAWDSAPVDFAGWADAVGARGQRIERPGQITAELLRSLTRGGSPAVLDIRHDASMRIRNGGRAESVRDMAGLK